MHGTVMFYRIYCINSLLVKLLKKLNPKPEKVGFRYMDVSILLSMTLMLAVLSNASHAPGTVEHERH